MTTTTSRIGFVDWDHRPAILVGDKAFAILKPGGAWTAVDRDDVWYTAALMSETAWRKRFSIRKGTMISDEALKHILTSFSVEGIYRQIKHEMRQEKRATEEEIELLFRANKKAAWPPCSLEHATSILADNVYAFRPAYDSPFAKSGTTWHALKHWPRRLPPTAEDFDNAARAVYAAWMEGRAALEAIKPSA